MNRKIKLFLIWISIVCSLAFLFSCADEKSTETDLPDSGNEELTDTRGNESTESEETEEHVHAFSLTETVEGDCKEQGYSRYACSCEMSYKVPIPAAHTYKQVKDVSGAYTKRVCVSCGEYKIVRNQEYLYNIDFEGVETPAEAAKQPPSVEFYVIAGEGASVKQDDEGACMKIGASNYYLRDTSGIFVSGKTFVFSMDIKVEKYAQAELLSIVYQNGSKWAYNRGVVRLEADGTLGFFSNGNGKYTKTVRLSDKGYNNITVVGDLKNCLFDIYVNEELVREDVSYIASPNADTVVYIRYFDQKKAFVAYADNLKLYAAETPEFVVPASGIVFSE